MGPSSRIPAAIGEGTRGRKLRGARGAVPRLWAALRRQVDGWATLLAWLWAAGGKPGSARGRLLEELGKESP